MMTSAKEPELPHERHRRRRVRHGFVLTIVFGAPVALLLAWPQAMMAERLPVIAQLIAFRAALAIALLIGAALFALIALVRRRLSIAAALSVVLVAAGGANAVVLLSRSADGTVSEAAAETEGDVTVLAWNTLGGSASPQSIARLVIDTDADIVSLPETDETTVAEVARLVALEGMTMTYDTTRGADGDSDIPTSVLISAALGDYRIDADAGSTPDLPSGVWEPVDGTGPRIVAAHPLPPLPGMLSQWSSGLDWVLDHCAVPDVIIAGDLNATVDHFGTSFGGCRDAALESGIAGRGTWPASAPAWLASPIDHVLVGAGWQIREASVSTVSDDAGSDHRPIVAVVSPVPR